jgi:hypothetical protein
MIFQKYFLIFSNITLIIPLGFYSYHGFFSRYLADDFCTSAYFQQHGFLQSMLFWRMTWSGRYSFYFFMNITHSLGQWLTPFITGITILAWLGALFIFARLLFQALKIPESRLFTLLFASIILFATLDGAPDIYQSLYWHTGLVTYVFPLIMFTLYGAYLLNRLMKKSRINPIDMALSAGIPLAAGGFSETYVSVQVTAILAFLVLVFLFANGELRRRGIIILGWGFVGAATALLLVVTAPGNAARISLILEYMRGYQLVIGTIRHTMDFSKSALYFTPISAIAALIAPGLLASYLLGRPNDQPDLQSLPHQKHLSILFFIPLLSFLLIASTIAPSLYATADPASRALITAQFILISSFAIWSLLLGFFLREMVKKLPPLLAPVSVIIGLLLISGSAISFQKTLVSLPDVQQNARLWDRRDQEVREAVAVGAQEIEAISLPHLSPGLAELSYSSDDWVNQCFALHYGLKKVSAK